MTQPQRSTKETHFHRSRIRDSIAVQKRQNKTLDDEDHEENPHLQDFLVPKNAVHIQRPSETEAEKLRNAVAGLELEDDEEHDDDDDDGEEKKEEADAGHADARAAGSADVALLETKESSKPTLARPCPSILHKSDCASRKQCEDTEKRRRVGFDKVVVRDYAMTLGDHPNCNYGPPIALGWDYLEYEPLSVDEYEFHHSRRRPLRLLMLNYYRRTAILSENMGYSEVELKAAYKEVKRVQLNRYITRNLVPFQKVDIAIESARRKAKRMICQPSPEENCV